MGRVLAPEAQGAPKLVEGLLGDFDPFEDAGLQMAVEDEEPGLFEPGARGEELVEDVLTAAVFFEHLAEAANLAFHARQPVLQLLVVVLFLRHPRPRGHPPEYPVGVFEVTIQQASTLSTLPGWAGSGSIAIVGRR